MMMGSRFLWKLYAGYSALILLSTAVVGGLVAQRTEQDSLEEIQQSLRARAVLLKDLAAQSLETSPDPTLQERIHMLGTEIDTRLTVIRTDGEVIADSEISPAGMDNHANRPEILAVDLHGIGVATRFSNTMGMNMMYLALPVQDDNYLLGYVRTSLPLSMIDNRLSHLRTVVVLGSGLAGIVALVLGFFLAKRFVKPLTSMTAVAESMACGNYDQRLSIAGKDEIGKLAQALNRMAQSCRNQMEAINTDRNKLSAILAGMVEGVIAIDWNERVVHMNEAAGEILSVSPEESMDKPISVVTPLHEFYETLRNTLYDEIGMKRELRLKTGQRDQIIGMHTSPLYDGQEKLVGAVVVLYDVSELRGLEGILRDFMADASHELKTPITAIRGLVETLIEDREMASEDHERFLVKIQRQSIRLSAIVTDLLMLSRLESENGGFESVPLDLRDIILDSARILTPTDEKRSITLETQAPDTPLEVMGDEEALCQVINNLLDNAFKYTPNGGKVTIRLQSTWNNAVIEVQDTGIGIEPAYKNRIFERFYRVDKARSRELGGTGLGLSIVKQIVLAHGGHVSVNSIPGTGSTFRVSLPLASAPIQTVLHQ